MSFTQQLPIRRNPSSMTLDSIFSRTESTSTFASTPAESHVLSTVPSFSGLSSLIQKKIQSKTAVVLVGLPGSGKSTICRQLTDYLNARGYNSLIYNAGNIRRAMSNDFSDAEFFNPNNTEAKEKRELYATMCVENMLDDLKENRVNVGFLDATNSTRVRRHSMLDLICNADFEIQNVFVLDISCTEPRLINYNITSKAFNQDYQGKDIATSISDFKRRAGHYYRAFEPISDDEFADFGKVKRVSIQDGGKVFQAPAEAAGEVASEIDVVLASFAANYYKLYGERYHAAVDEFYNFAFGKDT